MFGDALFDVFNQVPEPRGKRKRAEELGLAAAGGLPTEESGAPGVLGVPGQSSASGAPEPAAPGVSGASASGLSTQVPVRGQKGVAPGKKALQTAPSPTPSVLVEDVPPDDLSDEEATKAPPTGREGLESNFGAYTEQRVLKNYEGDRCWAEVCYPPFFDFERLATENSLREKREQVARKPAKEYPFVLDDFQNRSILCLERTESVLVSAHTSAGKTVVAQYAIAMALRDGQRVIYTSPIKALSNQKYRELYEEFRDVGLMTGDIAINPSASCLVMTTEILRNMLYRGSEVMREVAWVIFDEVHYMNNRERGVVWEETIILLPPKVRCVFLSATIPNATEFALWIAKLHNQPCNVVYTDFRPTPLQHYVFPSGGEGMYLVLDEKGNFKEQNFQKALTVLQQDALGNSIGAAPSKDEGESTDGKKRRRKPMKQGESSDIYKVVKMILDRHYDPVIVFSFSKRDCEQHALNMSKLDFCSMEEKTLVSKIFSNAMDSLSVHDRNLPQVQNILPLLKRGIGIHHGGLLPILKEVIEILFQEGLVKALFSTETFSMGLNMPAKTVVFTNVFKFDGQNFRPISSGEYIQMSGRAGRRGLDQRGIVVLMLDEQLEPQAAKNMIKGASDPLKSSFHLGYNMLLNLLRLEHADPEYLMARSFYQFQQNMKAPALIQQMEALEKEKSEIAINDLVRMAEYHHLKQSLDTAQKGIREIMCMGINILPFLNPGRLVKVRHESVEWGWGVVVNFQKKNIPLPRETGEVNLLAPTPPPDPFVMTESIIVDILIGVDGDQPYRTTADKVRPAATGTKASYVVIPFLVAALEGLSSARIILPRDLKVPENRKLTGKKILETLKRFEKGPPMLDPVEDMKIADENFKKLILRSESLESRLKAHPLSNDPQLTEQYSLYKRRVQLEENIAKLKLDIKNATQDVALRQTLKSMKRVLRRLGFVTKDDVIATKGRVACEISTCDELLGTELMFSGVFNELPTEVVVALCSTLVFDEKGEDNTKLRDELVGPFRKLQEAAKRIGTTIVDSKLPLNVVEYVKSFRPDIMEIVLMWCQGSKFADICKVTNVFEGTIIRVMRRLDELLKQFAQAAKAIGNETLEAKFVEGMGKLKRDIVFAASLYL